MKPCFKVLRPQDGRLSPSFTIFTDFFRQSLLCRLSSVCHQLIHHLTDLLTHSLFCCCWACPSHSSSTARLSLILTCLLQVMLASKNGTFLEWLLLSHSSDFYLPFCLLAFFYMFLGFCLFLLVLPGPTIWLICLLSNVIIRYSSFNSFSDPLVKILKHLNSSCDLY